MKILPAFLDVLTGLDPILIFIGLGVLGVVLVLGTLPFMLKRPEDPYAKLKKQSAMSTASKSEERLRTDTKNDKLEKYSHFLEPQDEEEFSAIKLKLIQAGYRGKNAVRTYHFAQFALGVGFLILGLGYTILASQNSEPSTQRTILSILLPAVCGYMLPKYWVTRRQEARKEAISDGFPDSLDMMLVCVEAGQSLDQSITRVAGELQSGFPELAEEYTIVSHEMKAGKDKTSVLRDMSERAGNQDVTSFVTVLIQSTSFGTSIADALRVYAEEMRDKRVMRAEEKANTLPTKMTLATMMLTVPPLLIILLGPSVYGISQNLGNIGQ